MKKHAFSRRAILRGAAGIAIGLPLLEVTHGEAWAQSIPVQKRFIVVFEHGGTISPAYRDGSKSDGTESMLAWDDWAPLDPGESLVLGPIHQPLESWKSKLLVLRGIDNMVCTQSAPYNGAHGWANVSALSAATVNEVSDSEQLSGGPSIDQVIAERLFAANPTPFSSIHLEVEGHNYGTPFYKAANQPVDSEIDPLAAFNTLFANVTTGAPDPAVLKARAMKKSVLDGVISGFGLFKKKLGAADLITVDAHLEHIRDIERRLDALSQVPVCSKPTGVTTTQNNELVGPLMADMIVAALRCGLTHVATLNIADIITNWLPTPYGPVAYDIGHSLHHDAREVGVTGTEYARRNEWREEMQINRRWRQSLIARILDGLEQTPEGDKTMLDNSLLLTTSEFSCGAQHSCADMPILLAGSAGGYFRTGRHVNFNTRAASNPATLDYATNTSFHNLYTSILQAFDQPDTHFGNEMVSYKGPAAGLT